ncbi:hypothetical protein [Streptomyces sp. NPDC058412]|uniref:hypothetical protein n=1 Tax=Streptomyces sp. NPDC058412 TaxID=3346486 RepID=UPI003650F9AB
MTTSSDHSFFADLITATQLIKLSWPLGRQLLPSASLAGIVDAHAAPIAALIADRGSRPKGQLLGLRNPPAGAALCGALLLAAENLLGDRELTSLRSRALPLAREAFSRDRIYTGLLLKNSGISPVLSRATTRRIHGGQTRASLRAASHTHRYLLDEIPPFLPRAWFDQYFLTLLPKIPSYTSTVERTLRRATPLRLAELITGTTWGACAPALGLKGGNSRRTLKTLGHQLNPVNLWPAFEESVDRIAYDLDGMEKRVNYAKRRQSLEEWRLTESEWMQLRYNISSKLIIEKGIGASLGTVLVWSEVNEAERSQCPLMRPPHRTLESGRLPSLISWYVRTDLAHTSARFVLGRRLRAYASELAAACDSGRSLTVDAEDIARKDIADGALRS